MRRGVGKHYRGATVTYDSKEKSIYGGNPVELYSFVCGMYRLMVTNAEIAQLFDGATYETGWSITRNEPETSKETSHSNLEINVAQDFPIVSMFVLNAIHESIWLTLTRRHRDEAEGVTLWAGKIVNCSVNPSKRTATLTGKPIEAISKIGFQQSCSPQCNRRLYSVRCGVHEADFLTVTNLESVSDDGLTVTAAAFAGRADAFFNLGELFIPSLGAHIKILSHIGPNLALLYSIPGLVAGVSAQALAGCDHVWKREDGSWGDCKAKFDNVINAMMWPFVPIKNPYSVGLDG
jgi:hypothetical protein